MLSTIVLATFLAAAPVAPSDLPLVEHYDAPSDLCRQIVISISPHMPKAAFDQMRKRAVAEMDKAQAECFVRKLGAE